MPSIRENKCTLNSFWLRLVCKAQGSCGTNGSCVDPRWCNMQYIWAPTIIMHMFILCDQQPTLRLLVIQTLQIISIGIKKPQGGNVLKLSKIVKYLNQFNKKWNNNLFSSIKFCSLLLLNTLHFSIKWARLTFFFSSAALLVGVWERKIGSKSVPAPDDRTRYMLYVGFWDKAVHCKKHKLQPTIMPALLANVSYITLPCESPVPATGVLGLLAGGSNIHLAGVLPSFFVAFFLDSLWMLKFGSLTFKTENDFWPLAAMLARFSFRLEAAMFRSTVLFTCGSSVWLEPCCEPNRETYAVSAGDMLPNPR